MFGDFVLLNVIILSFWQWHWLMNTWPEGRVEIFILVNNIALMLSEMRYSTLIHLRLVSAGDILKRIIGLSVTQVVLAFILLKVIDYELEIRLVLWWIGTVYFLTLLLKRFVERWFVKLYREAGRNTRTVTLVGSDPELLNIYEKLKSDATLGYNVLGYYGDESLLESLLEKTDDFSHGNKKKDKKKKVLERLGSLDDFLARLEAPESLSLGDELYLCISRREKDTIRKVSRMCDHKVIRFYFVPVSVESIGLNLKREMMDEIEIFTTYENPLQNPMNKLVKRIFDIVLSLMFLIPTAILYPFIWLIIKIQSPGPIFFKQKRTGLDGRDFY